MKASLEDDTLKLPYKWKEIDSRFVLDYLIVFIEFSAMFATSKIDLIKWQEFSF